jgi:hypothetical protein
MGTLRIKTAGISEAERARKGIVTVLGLNLAEFNKVRDAARVIVVPEQGDDGRWILFDDQSVLCFKEVADGLRLKAFRSIHEFEKMGINPQWIRELLFYSSLSGGGGRKIQVEHIDGLGFSIQPR